MLPIVLAAVLAPAALPASAAQSAADLYDAAIKTMANLPEPDYVAYRLEGRGIDSQETLQIHLKQERDNHSVFIDTTPGGARSTWLVVHREQDFANAIVDEARQDYYTNRSFFDPTWNGAYSALHDGMFGAFAWKQPDPKPAPSAQPSTLHTLASVSVPAPGPYGVTSDATPAPPNSTAPAKSSQLTPASSPILPSDLKTIALIHVMGPGVYQVRDDGPAICENGDAGRAIHLTARVSVKLHQLTDAIVDLHLMRFCMLRFSFSPDGWDLIVEQHYAEVGGYWVQTGGMVSADEPMRTPPSFGLFMPAASSLPFGKVRVNWRYELFGMSFPKYIPNEVFDGSLH